jgi:hypothetical protein
MPNSLTTNAGAASDLLNAQMHAVHTISVPRGIRDSQLRADAFLATSSRRVSALEAVLVDAVRRHLGPARADELRQACHALQLAMRTMHTRLYGSSQSMRMPWSDIWADVERHLETLLRLEQELAADLADLVPEHDLDAISGRLIATQLRAPTRPHPHLPRRGLRGRLARRLASRADAFWDGVQGRAVPPMSSLSPATDTGTGSV